MKRQKPKFKPYEQGQMMAFPPTLEELIPDGHPVRVVNQVLDKINLAPLLKKYKGGGCSSYHPRMMLKVLIYGYLSNIYSSRKLEAATRENIYFMWLSGMEQPDHNTLNRFRSERLKGVIKRVFSEVVLMMASSGHVDLQQIYTDGTKIESSANRYTFVWGKAIKTNRERISRQLEELWQYAEQVAKQELADPSPTQFAAIDPEEVNKTIDLIDRALEDKPVAKKIRQKVKYAKKHWPEQLKSYQEKEAILEGRNSYSKTDHDATFMRMKEDHMGNGQLKPAYNVQISTSDQMIAHYGIHQNPTDTLTLKTHLETFQQELGVKPKELVADAGYGSEDNYDYLASNQIEAYVKDNYFDKTQHKKELAKGNFHPDNLHYNNDLNCYYCPMGQPMKFIGNKVETTKSGYQRRLSCYQACNCNGCPIRGACQKSKNNRIIEVSHHLIELRKRARELLNSEKGIAHRKKRPVDVEPVFGMIKQNRGFRRFLLKGIEKVTIEFGLVALAHNMMKLCSLIDLKGFFAAFLLLLLYPLSGITNMVRLQKRFQPKKLIPVSS
jgi:transposase